MEAVDPEKNCKEFRTEPEDEGRDENQEEEEKTFSSARTFKVREKLNAVLSKPKPNLLV